jgi:hypothetical protein
MAIKDLIGSKVKRKERNLVERRVQESGRRVWN